MTHGNISQHDTLADQYPDPAGYDCMVPKGNIRSRQAGGIKVRSRHVADGRVAMVENQPEVLMVFRLIAVLVSNRRENFRAVRSLAPSAVPFFGNNI